MEKDLTLDIARRVDRLLDSEGVATLMTRLGDSYVSLADRAAFGNRANESIFISIHFNEDNKPVASGVETYYAAHQINFRLYFRFVAAVFLAAAVQFAQARKPKSRRFHSGSAGGADPLRRSRDASQTIFVIANVTSPAVLIEGGFITNKDELSKLVERGLSRPISGSGCRRHSAVSRRGESAEISSGSHRSEER